MSMQTRRTCQVLDMLLSGRQVTAQELSDELEYDEASVRQMLRILTELGYAKHVGVGTGKPGTKPRIFGAGAKLTGGASV